MTPEKLLGRQLGPYKIEKILGAGGMAVVYQAYQANDEAVALKVLFPPPDAGEEIRLRFKREAQTAARLRHPGIVRVLDTGHIDEYAYLTMTLVQGQTLANRLIETAPFDETLAADIAWQIADALYYAHSQGVVHRDVKPSNILLTNDNQALLTDFGVAQALDDPSLTRTGHTVGTPAYMAPEQASGNQAVDGRADLYSLGIALYHMVAGRTPFQGSTPQVLYAHVYDEPPPPSTIAQVSPKMEAIILKALHKDVSKRFQTGAAMAQALASLSNQTDTYANLPAPGVSNFPSPAKRYLRWFWVIPLLLISVIAFWQFNSLNANTPITSLNPSSTLLTSTLSPSATLTTIPSPTPVPTQTETPSPTFTPINTITPVPSFTFTPQPSSTPNPSPQPLTSPTLKPSTPTSIPLSTATPCPVPIDSTFANLIQNDNISSQALGCPRTEATIVTAAWQPFEQGALLWRQDSNQIYILESNTWYATGDAWRTGDTDPIIDNVPNGLYHPVRGFGLVWREQPEVREALGWGTAEESSVNALIQEFITGGLIWYDTERETMLILFNDRTYQSAE